MIMTARQLSEVTNYVDWDKLRDEYMIAVYDSSERKEQRDGIDESTTDEQQQNPEQARRKLMVQEKHRPKRQRGKRAARQRRPGFKLHDADRDMRDLGTTDEADTEFDVHVDADDAGIVTETDAATLTATTMATDEVSDSRSLYNPTTPWINENGALLFVVDPGQDYGGGVSARQQGLDDDVVRNQGIDIPIYNYSRGNCPGPGDSAQAVPCAPDNLEQICSKYNDAIAPNDPPGKFSDCFNACRPAFCCIHGEWIYGHISAAHVCDCSVDG